VQEVEIWARVALKRRRYLERPRRSAPVIVPQVAASTVALRRTRALYWPQPRQSALMRVPRLAAHTCASTGAQPLRIET